MEAEPYTPTSWDEQALLFDCAGDTLVGVLARPAVPRKPLRLGVLIVVGGPQYRAGSHRQFVTLARSLAAAGHAVLRFDYRGMGDSSGTARDFLCVDDDIEAAIDAMQAAVPDVHGVALWGLCDGASAALLYSGRPARDARVERLVLLNPWVRSAQGLARMQVTHYYRQRLREPAFWRKLLSGRVARNALADLVRAVRIAFAGRGASADRSAAVVSTKPFPVRMAQAWHGYQGTIFLLLSENDYTAKEFLALASSDPSWQRALSRGVHVQQEIAGADHTLSDPAHARTMERGVATWLTSDAQPATMALAPSASLRGARSTP